MEITIKIDTRKKEARAFLEYIKNLSFIDIEEKVEGLTDEEKELLGLMKKSEKSGLADKKEFEQKLKNL